MNHSGELRRESATSIGSYSDLDSLLSDLSLHLPPNPSPQRSPGQEPNQRSPSQEPSQDPSAPRTRGNRASLDVPRPQRRSTSRGGAPSPGDVSSPSSGGYPSTGYSPRSATPSDRRRSSPSVFSPNHDAFSGSEARAKRLSNASSANRGSRGSSSSARPSGLARRKASRGTVYILNKRRNRRRSSMWASIRSPGDTGSSSRVAGIPSFVGVGRRVSADTSGSDRAPTLADRLAQQVDVGTSFQMIGGTPTPVGASPGVSPGRRRSSLASNVTARSASTGAVYVEYFTNRSLDTHPFQRGIDRWVAEQRKQPLDQSPVLPVRAAFIHQGSLNPEGAFHLYRTHLITSDSGLSRVPTAEGTNDS
ncbi:hypothetical protein GNI_176960 [Gregarina niphandrodes]|uniref:Uncharacterized protein n=1 Tax=Gregarina niphandrodes TaxID=110365 RepID=A0A023AXX4_GRENI|nr:hypothetical protein GNI_176960 [Gregarina niphandrodes]EZG43318.1 hypothetical protein GNI_176960 [Gregarina niphandrodes]|eukprot:XP_011133428.1 hypothetical protein GNI_176960 [Gregarina niphandrodes]